MASNRVPGYPTHYGTNSSEPEAPFYFENRTSAGGAQTETRAQRMFYVFNAAGPDSIQDLEQNVRMHQLEICRVWFTLPGSATIPVNNTLWLLFQQAGANSSIGRTAIHYGHTDKVFDHTVEPPTITEADPTQNAPSIQRDAVAVMNLGNVAAGDTVEWENKCHVVHIFPGDSRGISKMRIVLVDDTGAVYTDLDTNRIYIEAVMYAEVTMR